MALEITDGNYAELVESSDKLVVLDFWAEWCGPCKMIGPIIEELHTEYAEKVVIGKVDVDSNNETSAKHKVRNIPTILFIKNGEVVDKMVGNQQKKTLVDKIESLM